MHEKLAAVAAAVVADVASSTGVCPYCRRSINPASVARAARRARVRGDLPTAAVPLAAPPTPANFVAYVPPKQRLGPLDRGDLEFLRRCLVVLVAGSLSRQLQRSPGEICTSVADLTANRLRPTGLARITVDPEGGYTSSTQ